jgi:SAM-dependent methyltransferase
MGSNQDQIFVAVEGNNYFKRNKSAMERFDPEADFPLRLMELYHLRPRSVLEVGAANGFGLAVIAERYSARVVAVELSMEAILDGRAKYPSVEFIPGEAGAIPLQEMFDLIIVNFVFHWIDRANLLRSVAEVDRLLVDGGFLIIGDFLPSNLIKVRYHHLAEQEVYTYKQNYAATFPASGLYHPLCLKSGDHSSQTLTEAVGEDKRIGVWLLRKMLKEHYVEGPRCG